MGFATSLEMKQFLGEDVGHDAANDETTSPSGIVVETLLNMGTVSALNMEEERFKNFQDALTGAEPHYIREGFMQGFLSGTLTYSCQGALDRDTICPIVSDGLLFRRRPLNVHPTVDQRSSIVVWGLGTV